MTRGYCGAGVALGVALLATVGRVDAQVLLTGTVPGTALHLFQSDMAVFEAGEDRKDLPCDVSVNKPVLGFDLKFHTGYEVSIPLHELAGSENLLTIIFRVTKQDDGGSAPLFLTQKIRVPAIEADAKGDAFLQGTWDIGEGKYKVSWLMRDRAERLCSTTWDLEAVLPPKDKQVELTLAPGTIEEADHEQFKDEPPVPRKTEEPLNVKVLVNFAPQNSRSTTLQPFDTSALVSILRSISRDPRIGKFSIVAFNLQEQRVIYRQDSADKIDFPALGHALDSVNLGTVDLRRLSQKNGEVSFLADLMTKELKTSENADAVVFAGPKAMLDENVPQDSLKEIGSIQSPLFYMNYNLYPQAVPWTDSIGKAVKFFKGYEYTISRPRDVWFAVTEMVSRIVKLKHGRTLPTSSSE